MRAFRQMLGETRRAGRQRLRGQFRGHFILRGYAGIGMTEEEMRKRLEVLRIEHRDLDAAIDALTAANSTDQLQLARLKKRKLRLKDQIAMIEDYLIPDIIA
jgi:hypothetical protein